MRINLCIEVYTRGENLLAQDVADDLSSRLDGIDAKYFDPSFQRDVSYSTRVLTAKPEPGPHGGIDE